MSKRLLNAKELAHETGLKLSRIYQLSREGKIPFVIIGERQYVYPEARIERWLGLNNSVENEEKEVDGDEQE
jgi:predicted DNA-binding transcriptional regulator AlpA